MRTKTIFFLNLCFLGSLISWTVFAKDDQQLIDLIESQAISIPEHKDLIIKFGNPDEDKLPQNLKILVWNLFKQKSANHYNEFLRLSSNKDLIIAQEMHLAKSDYEILNNQNRYEYVTATSFMMNSTGLRTGVYTASIAKASRIRYLTSQYKEPVTKTPKLTLFTNYKIQDSNEELLIVNIHGINFVSNIIFKHELNRIVHNIKSHKGPIIFAGDFNTWNSERKLFLDQTTQQLNLRAASFYPDFRTSFLGHKLDHFYHSKEIIIRKAKSEVSIHGSDHSPLELEISLNLGQ